MDTQEREGACDRFASVGWAIGKGPGTAERRREDVVHGASLLRDLRCELNETDGMGEPCGGFLRGGARSLSEISVVTDSTAWGRKAAFRLQW